MEAEDNMQVKPVNQKTKFTRLNLNMPHQEGEV